MGCQDSDRATFCQAGFRHRCSGCVVPTGAFHDISLLPGEAEASLDEWEAGFLDAQEHFFDRREAARVLGHRGRLEAVSYFHDEPEPTLEAGHAESWCVSLSAA
jgi:hypothetical protein